MLPHQFFRYCPACAAPLSAIGCIPLVCSQCRFCLFFNPAVAAGAYIRHPQTGCYLLIRRAKEPAQGRLAIPGGFLDIGETAEQGLVREVREEVNLELGQLNYLCSCRNDYHYRGVVYPVCDLIFSAVALNPEATAALDAVAEILWLPLEKIDPADLAFSSIVAGLNVLRSGRA